MADGKPMRRIMKRIDHPAQLALVGLDAACGQATEIDIDNPVLRTESDSKPRLVLATRCFQTKREATAFFSEMKNRYQDRQRVCDEDAVHLLALLELHPEYVDKVGCGVSYFEVRSTKFGTPGFWLIRKDGSGTDFSYVCCINQKPWSRIKEVSQAFRRVVHDDIRGARRRFLKEHVGQDGLVACAVTHERIAPEAGQIDHRPPMTFQVILTTFLKDREMSLNAVPLTESQDNQVSHDITCPALAEDFRSYHNKHALLDFVKKHVNLAQSGRHRIRPTRITLDK